LARRRANHADWCEKLSPYVQVFPEAPGTEHASFAFAMIVDGDRAALMAFLEARRIETRPISGSNLVRQPAFASLSARTPVPLEAADLVHERGFFVGNSHALGPGHGARLAETIQAWRAA
jgi:CDP-6-deoxy-D-xylo-4-hexulose-3-dehydrase